MTSGSGPEGSVPPRRDSVSGKKEILKEFGQEGREIVSHQINWAMEADRDLMKLIRYNLLILGGLVSLVTYLSNLEWITVGQVVSSPTVWVSAFFWCSSIVLVAIAYHSIRVEFGPMGEHYDVDHSIDVDDIHDEDVTPTEYYEAVAKSYDELTRRNTREINMRYSLHTGVVLLMIASISTLLLNLVGLVVQEHAPLLNLTSAAATVVGALLVVYFMRLAYTFAEFSWI